MKVLSSIFTILFFVACSGPKPKEKEPCEIKSLEEKHIGAVGVFEDFTISNVKKIRKDDEGTEWKDETTDEYRFVIYQDSTILVYEALL